MREIFLEIERQQTLIMYSKNIMWLGHQAILFVFVDSTEISKKETVMAMKKAQKLLLASVTHEF